MIAAVTQRVVRDSAYGETRDALSHEWYPFLTRAGVQTIIPVPNIGEPIMGWLQIVSPDVLVLTGGNDVHYGQEFAGPRDSLSDLRDLTEMHCLQYAFSKTLPVLGVCRGMQMIHAYFGGKLAGIDGHAGTVHEIECKWPDEHGTEWIRRVVNSYHDFAVREPLHPDLIPIGVHRESSAIEAFMHSKLPVLGIMWHPERNQPFDEQDLIWVKRILSAGKGA